MREIPLVAASREQAGAHELGKLVLRGPFGRELEELVTRRETVVVWHCLEKSDADHTRLVKKPSVDVDGHGNLKVADGVQHALARYKMEAVLFFAGSGGISRLLRPERAKRLAAMAQRLLATPRKGGKAGATGSRCPAMR